MEATRRYLSNIIDAKYHRVNDVCLTQAADAHHSAAGAVLG